mmetsp:Transcript_19781/g.46141  ORF Transcript_19781/g.46141 Transcript_19781/m.46141 type:complete len:208 (-) Transcript_19781:516-1139(-)
MEVAQTLQVILGHLRRLLGDVLQVLQHNALEGHLHVMAPDANEAPPEFIFALGVLYVGHELVVEEQHDVSCDAPYTQVVPSVGAVDFRLQDFDHLGHVVLRRVGVKLAQDQLALILIAVLKSQVEHVPTHAPCPAEPRSEAQASAARAVQAAGEEKVGRHLEARGIAMLLVEQCQSLAARVRPKNGVLPIATKGGSMRRPNGPKARL